MDAPEYQQRLLGPTACYNFFTTYRLIFFSVSPVKKVTNHVPLSLVQFPGCLPVC